jgi:hypothetical protein
MVFVFFVCLHKSSCEFEGRKSLGRSRRRREDNIKMTLQGIRRDVVNWILVAQEDRLQWLTLAWWTPQWTFGFQKRQGIYWPAYQLSASEVFCVMKIVIQLFKWAKVTMLHFLIQCSDYAMGWTTGIRFPAGVFPVRHLVQTGSGAHPASCPVGTRGFFPGLKLPSREADPSPPSCAVIKNAWCYTSTPSYVFLAWRSSIP